MGAGEITRSKDSYLIHKESAKRKVYILKMQNNSNLCFDEKFDWQCNIMLYFNIVFFLKLEVYYSILLSWAHTSTSPKYEIVYSFKKRFNKKNSNRQRKKKKKTL